MDVLRKKITEKRSEIKIKIQKTVFNPVSVLVTKKHGIFIARSSESLQSSRTMDAEVNEWSTPEGEGLGSLVEGVVNVQYFWEWIISHKKNCGQTSLLAGGVEKFRLTKFRPDRRKNLLGTGHVARIGRVIKGIIDFDMLGPRIVSGKHLQKDLSLLLEFNSHKF